ncbi:alcohol dehydrogenase GroES-like protein [Hyaloraphidium curvatum]|nr:alcohol dehydrogenase GroES-like protein [Hyaloraphidium curvatum]
MALPDKMRAALTHSKGPLTFEDVPLPKPSAGELLMKVAACGVCHSDQMLSASAERFGIPDGFILGHEGAGTVAAVGENVKGWKVGDRILAPVNGGCCRKCEYCTRGLEQQCPDKSWFATHKNGFFAEYTVVNPDFVVRIPDNVPFDVAGPIGCAGVTVYAGLKRTSARSGDWVGLSGAGGLGQMAIQIGQTMGFKMLALDIDDSKLATAKKLGAQACVNPKTEGAKTPDAVRAHTGGQGLHAIIVVTTANSAFQQAPELVRGGGVVVFIGVPGSDKPIELDVMAVLMKEITIKGSVIGSTEDAAAALQLVAEGKVKPLVTPCSLDDLNDAFAKMDHVGAIQDRMVVTKFR